MSSETGAAISRLVQTLGVHQPTQDQAQVMAHPLTVSVDGVEVAAPLLVVAGAGSGKTETMSMRAVFLAAEAGVQDDTILGLTFTRKAAAELEARLTQRLAQLRARPGPDVGVLEFESAPQASTYDAFALDVVREFGPSLGISADFVHLDTAAAWQLMLDTILEWEGNLPTDLLPETLADRALELRQQIANQALSTDQVRPRLERLSRKFENNLAERKRAGKIMGLGLAANELRLKLLDVIEEFEDRKRALGRLDFVDQTMLATRIVKSLPSARETLRKRHQVVFLDEFQDTSVAQLRFLSALFADHPVTAVGDPNQAIYGWRGASAASLADFHDLFTTNPRSPRTTLTLATAWRNARDILEVANAVSEPLRLRSAPERRELGSVSTPVLEAAPGAPKGDIVARYLPSVEAEDAAVVEFLRENFADAAKAGLPKPSAAILSRTRRRMVSLLEACRRAGIPAEIGGEDGLLMHPAVVDLRAALEVAHDIGKSTQLLRLLGNLDLGASDLYELGRLAQTISRDSAKQTGGARGEVLLLEAVEQLQHATPDPSGGKLSAQALSRVQVLGSQLEKVRGANDWTIVEQLEYARKIFALDEQALVLGEGASVTEVLDSFARAAADYQDSAIDATMTSFLTWLSIAETKERGLPLPRVDSTPGAVQILTIHAAKGLEWDLVSVVGLGCGSFPSGGMPSAGAQDSPDGAVVKPPPIPAGDAGWWKAESQLPYPVRDDRAHLPNPHVWDPDMALGEVEAAMREAFGEHRFAEERRLAYVAFTRPRRKLMLTGAWVDTAARPRYPSPFFTEAAGALHLQDVIQPCPNAEQRDRIREGHDVSTFPVRPGAARKQIALSAARVLDELDLIGSPNPEAEPTLEEVLASLPDQELARSVRVLLDERNEALRLRDMSTEERARAAVLSDPNLLSFFTVTQLASLEADPETFVTLRRPLPGKPSRAAAVGTAFHAWVEGHLRRASAAASEQEPPVGGEHGSTEPLFLTSAEEERLEQMRSQFGELSWVRALEVDGLEVPFDVELDGLLVRGRIDAVFSDPDTGKTLLVDWKTGSPPRETGDLSADLEQIQRLLVQLELYVYAWQGREAAVPQAMLVFVGEGGTQTLTLEQLREKYRKLAGKELSVTQLAAQWRQLQEI